MRLPASEGPSATWPLLGGRAIGSDALPQRRFGDGRRTDASAIVGLMVRRTLGLFALGASALACGVSLMGAVDEDGHGADAGADTAPNLPPGTSDGEPSDAGRAPDAEPVEGGSSDADASLPDPESCPALCGDAGTCNALGMCEIDCSASDACNAGVVTCPPGAACQVNCSGKGACKEGVDCTGALACEINCTGDDSCKAGQLRCAGLGCKVSCSGKRSCAQGIRCTAAKCELKCLGTESCLAGAVECDASSTCAVRCGGSDGSGESACRGSVTCSGGDSCTVHCNAKESCKDGNVVARSAGKVEVLCLGEKACQNRVSVSGGDAGVRCEGAGACKAGIACDAGSCFAACKSTNTALCCSNPDAAAPCTTTEDSCQIDKTCS